MQIPGADSGVYSCPHCAEHLAMRRKYASLLNELLTACNRLLQACTRTRVRQKELDGAVLEAHRVVERVIRELSGKETTK